MRRSGAGAATLSVIAGENRSHYPSMTSLRLGPLGLLVLLGSLPARAAESDGTMFNNPRVPNTQEVRRLFEYAYAGHDVDF